MPNPLSRSQIERLGVRLVRSPAPSEEDLALLHELLAAYGEVLAETVDRVGRLGFAPTSRIKNTGTILEKLHRYGGSWLKSIQDLAGMRIVGDFNRRVQDQLASALVAAFSEESRSPHVVDRRAEPVQGYRAVHVIVFPRAIPVEIQIRTRWQHEWADLFEKLADRVGRGIRYGEAPRPVEGHDDFPHVPLWNEAVAAVEASRTGIVELAFTVADAISLVEEAENEGLGGPRITEMGRRTQTLLEMFRDQSRRLAQLEDEFASARDQAHLGPTAG